LLINERLNSQCRVLFFLFILIAHYNFSSSIFQAKKKKKNKIIENIAKKIECVYHIPLPEIGVLKNEEKKRGDEDKDGEKTQKEKHCKSGLSRTSHKNKKSKLNIQKNKAQLCIRFFNLVTNKS
ncbi:hypothetical protein RFI_39360, partial [Reticulomyxa filosa]